MLEAAWKSPCASCKMIERKGRKARVYSLHVAGKGNSGGPPLASFILGSLYTLSENIPAIEPQNIAS